MTKSIIIAVSVAILVLLGLWAYNYHQKTLIQARQDAISDLMNKDKLLQAKIDSAANKAVILSHTIDSLTARSVQLKHDTVYISMTHEKQANTIRSLDLNDEIRLLSINISGSGRNQ